MHVFYFFPWLISPATIMLHRNSENTCPPLVHSLRTEGESSRMKYISCRLLVNALNQNREIPFISSLLRYIYSIMDVKYVFLDPLKWLCLFLWIGWVSFLAFHIINQTCCPRMNPTDHRISFLRLLSLSAINRNSRNSKDGPGHVLSWGSRVGPFLAVSRFWWCPVTLAVPGFITSAPVIWCSLSVHLSSWDPLFSACLLLFLLGRPSHGMVGPH